MLKSIMPQFVHPTGFMGRIVGIIMAYENRQRNAWAVSQLNIQPSNRILEIGFGPGVAIQFAAKLAVNGPVAGVDHSTVMVNQAGKRNRRAIQAGRVELKSGTASALPYPDSYFDTVFAVNNFHQWPDKGAGLREVQRVLKPGGMIAIIEQPISAVPDEQVQGIGEKTARQLGEVGFHDTRITSQPMKPAATVCVRAVK